MKCHECKSTIEKNEDYFLTNGTHGFAICATCTKAKNKARFQALRDKYAAMTSSS